MLSGSKTNKDNRNVFRKERYICFYIAHQHCHVCLSNICANKRETVYSSAFQKTVKPNIRTARYSECWVSSLSHTPYSYTRHAHPLLPHLEEDTSVHIRCSLSAPQHGFLLFWHSTAACWVSNEMMIQSWWRCVVMFTWSILEELCTGWCSAGGRWQCHNFCTSRTMCTWPTSDLCKAYSQRFSLGGIISFRIQCARAPKYNQNSMCDPTTKTKKQITHTDQTQILNNHCGN